MGGEQEAMSGGMPSLDDHDEFCLDLEYGWAEDGQQVNHPIGAAWHARYHMRRNQNLVTHEAFMSSDTFIGLLRGTVTEEDAETVVVRRRACGRDSSLPCGWMSEGFGVCPTHDAQRLLRAAMALAQELRHQRDEAVALLREPLGDPGSYQRQRWVERRDDFFASIDPA